MTAARSVPPTLLLTVGAKVVCESLTQPCVDMSLGRASRGQSPYRLIHLDLPRTFTSTGLFVPDGPLHRSTTEILEVVAVLLPEIGYVQGMSYLAATLLLYMDEFDAFAMLATLVSNPFFACMCKMDVKNIVRYFRVFDLLFSYNLPALYDHFKSLGISHEQYLLDWMLTVFTKSMPVIQASRIWDCFVFEGELFLLIAALGVLRHYRRYLRTAPFEDCLALLSGGGLAVCITYSNSSVYINWARSCRRRTSSVPSKE